ncbi:methyltransferase domain-containing protein [Mycolicibacterium chlorophenolicum]|nr:methyltransferase domain-containing protein [Mycolicibacterium chlorophenolicum]
MSGNKDVFYDQKFYEGQRANSSASAHLVIPLVKDIVDPRSVLDVGCGVGTWINAWLQAGVEDALGVDGDYVDRNLLQCPADKFVSHDLNAPLSLARRFDLVTCLEVAEHLPDYSAPTLVKSLIQHGDVVMFSAAVPNQGGTHHVNEQWPSYWVALFDTHGFNPYDLIRPRIWFNDRIEWWYRQNILIFANEDAASRLDLASSEAPIDIAHPAFVEAATRAVPLSTQVKERLREGGKRLLADTPVERPLRRLAKERRSR